MEAQHLRRRLHVAESPAGTTITINGRRCIAMASNNYLGLANHPAVKQAAVDAIAQWGVGAGAARLLAGTMPPHAQLEHALAKFKQVDAALTFATGYMTNLGLVPALADRDDLILADRACHASLIQACRISNAALRVFRHNDVDHLDTLLQQRRSRRRHTGSILVVTEGVFSMDGDLAPLPELLTVCRRHDAALLVDDAHGTGVMGQHGRGTVEHFDLNPQDPNLIQMGTLSKALGAAGGYVVGTTGLKDYLINTSKAFIYTTAAPPAIAAAATAALHIIRTDPDRRARLWANRHYLHTALTDMGFQLTNTQSAILPIIVTSPETAMAFSRALHDAGIYAPAIRPPTVPKDSSRLRLTVSSEHTEKQLRLVCEALRKAGETVGVS